MTEVWKPGANS